ncbi:DISARM system helicase DrmA [Neobacillus sp. SAB-20_R2A]|uniref:DISARM system helicase DrmA n=1 Tax=Neobacillus sp. SAB-20_R2A TaxID=3120519 RepID=UPI003C6DDDD8
MKPGPKTVYQFLLAKEDKKANVTELIEQLPKLYLKKEQINRWAKEYADVFILDGDQLRIKTKDVPVATKEREKSKPMDMKPYVKRRSQLVNDLHKLFVGPFEEEEILGKRKPPMSFYLTGKLAPYGSTFEVINEDDNDIRTKEVLDTENLDEMLSNRNPFRPSSMGLSFRMKQLVPITITASWGMYDDEEHKRTLVQKEISFVPETKEFSLKEPAVLKCKVRERDGLFHVSLFLMNSYVRDSYPLQSEIMFQTQISISFQASAAAAFSSKADKWNYQDELLYRHVKEYAIGHGVGVDYHVDSETCTIHSNWLPAYELPVVEHRSIDQLNVRMMDLATVSQQELKENLSIIPKTYEKWLNQQRSQVVELPIHLQQVAEENIQTVEKMITRIKDGIDIVTDPRNPLEYQAFQFANKVMAIQQGQSLVALHYRDKKERIMPFYHGEWRLFQITFFLMNINGVGNPEHEDRDVVDLLWFPTGGGKTEAYLGLSAYLIGLRRLKGLAADPETYAGVTVLMRYTLRLLTTQQFQRATAMICAAETIRRSNPLTWGMEPFRIGLWIGQSSTPNKFEQAQEKLTEILQGNEVQEGNPMQLEHCPWCGTELTVHDYYVSSTKQKITCSNKRCEFSKEDGIPALTIDEAIYNYVPTIVIGTVDKIAQIAWNKRLGELFGKKTHVSPIEGFVNDPNYRQSHRINGNVIPTKKINGLIPPELIIQDELHLISGPLGSLTGLYEIAVDYLCQYHGRGPKIIASTATIRGAEEQVKRLYGRKVSQFPPQVLDTRDSFFSYEVPLDKKPGRLYLGVCAPGVSGTIHTVHAYSALLASVRKEEVDTTLDPYWTVLGYFNTVKELSGTSTKLKDEIPIRLKLISQTKHDWENLHTEEMTSRKKASEIPKLLSLMERSCSEEGALDVVLATNMISVGVDVNRLGVMVMHNQPKTAAEYIQATSRVGRKYPGLVLTLFNSLRSRDLSHYEQFISFHEAMYRHVEPTSVTSFAQGCRDRGMEGLIVGTVRQIHDNLGNETSAINFKPDKKTEDILAFVCERAEATGEISKEEIREEIEEIYNWWYKQTQEQEKLSYRQSQYRKIHLLKDFNEGTNYTEARPALNSLRNVESEIKVIEVRDYE